jgi:predicted DNA repair protein MutK
MAGGSLLLLLDDITTMLDDVSVMTKVAAKKTAGVLGDDLALNAQQVAGVDASRELPVVWAVAKGSFINKLILVPTALLLSFLSTKFGIHWLIPGLLMIGGAYLCFEGFEKIWHKFFHSKADVAHTKEIHAAMQDEKQDLALLERDKIKGAIRTDFILSAEIIVIALGTVATKTLAEQSAVLAGISIIMTVGVYGLVGLIVKLDDIGLWLMLKQGGSVLKQIGRKIGLGLINGTPYLMRFLSIAGTAAMFLVGGSIIAHNIPALHHIGESLGAWSYAYEGLVGVAVGALTLLLISAFQKLKSAQT